MKKEELDKLEDATIEVAGDCGLSYVGKNEDGELEFLGDQDAWDSFDEVQNCDHDCTSNCRREGCNCACGEWHLGGLAKVKIPKEDPKMVNEKLSKLVVEMQKDKQL